MMHVKNYHYEVLYKYKDLHLFPYNIYKERHSRINIDCNELYYLINKSKFGQSIWLNSSSFINEVIKIEFSKLSLHLGLITMNRRILSSKPWDKTNEMIVSLRSIYSHKTLSKYKLRYGFVFTPHDFICELA